MRYRPEGQSLSEREIVAGKIGLARGGRRGHMEGVGEAENEGKRAMWWILSIALAVGGVLLFMQGIVKDFTPQPTAGSNAEFWASICMIVIALWIAGWRIVALIGRHI